MTMRLTANQKAVLDYLRQPARGYVSPTQIGREVGGKGRHSAWASPICKKLVALGFAQRSERGWYAAISDAKTGHGKVETDDV